MGWVGRLKYPQKRSNLTKKYYVNLTDYYKETLHDQVCECTK